MTKEPLLGRVNPMTRNRIFLALAVVIAALCAGTRASAGWQCLKTEHFTVFYKPEYGLQAREALDAAKMSHDYSGVLETCEKIMDLFFRVFGSPKKG